MWSVKKNIVLFFLSAMMPAGLWAQESIDCIEYAGSPDPRCAYTRIDAGKGIGLFVVPEGEDVVSANALPNTDFFIYMPKASSDSLSVKLRSDKSDVTHMRKVNSGEDRIVITDVQGLYPIYNVVMGTAASEDGDIAIARVYNFYVPDIEYCLDYDCKDVVTSVSKLQLEVGDTLKVYVRAVIPVGPDAGLTDSTLEKDFYINTEGASDNLRFYTLGGTELPKGEKGRQLMFHEGRAAFLVCATKAVTDGSTFTLSGFEDPSATGDDIQFIVNSEFPGSLQFVNPDFPVPDSAFIYDTDGDGAGDSIVAFFSGRMDSVAMEKFAYNWPDGGKFKDHQGEWEWDPKKGILELTGVNVSIPADSGEGSLSVTMSSVNTGAKSEAQSVLTDRIGPVIKVANLIKGDAATDTLELFFNKDIDTSWTKGKGFILNGTPVHLEAIEKDGKHWFFVIDTGLVDFGDSIQIAVSCSNKACPDGLVKAADGNETGKNNPAIVQNSGRIYVDDERNAFFDRNGDGRMDSASIAFDTPITREDLENMVICYYWLDKDGKLLKIEPDVSKLTLSSDGTVVGFALKEDKYGIKENLTSIDQSYSKDGEYGYVSVTYFETKNGETEKQTINLAMHDRMAPVISGTFLEPESYQKMASDVFRIEFSESIDYKNISTDELSDALRFYVDGEWVKLPFTSVQWAKDGKSAEIHMESGTRLVDRMNPADSVRFDLAGVDFVDKEGNGISGLAPAKMVEGDPRVIMQNYSFASRRDVDETADDAITFEVADNLSSEEARKALGVLMDVSFSTILKKDEKTPEMDLSQIGMEWELEVYTNLGNFVARKSQKIKCDDREIFDGDCFENPHQLYLRWNMLSDKGRRVGVGAYVAHIKARVYGAKESFKVERFYNWGITGSRKIHSSSKK
ncbi:MAG: hypothetical protein IKP90_02410 [Fibrobacter sp.]|nr:hypothetical protein [Fibrobacter sp.]